MRLRAISPIIAVIMLIAIAIALGVVLYIVSNRMASNVGGVMVTASGTGSDDGSTATITLHVSTSRPIEICMIKAVEPTGTTTYVILANGTQTQLTGCSNPPTSYILVKKSTDIALYLTNDNDALLHGTTVKLLIGYYDPTSKTTDTKTVTVNLG